jgi:phosphoglycerate dehydrogenase-like enzyme
MFGCQLDLVARLSRSKRMSLVWLPFPAEHLGEVSGGLEFEIFEVRGEIPSSGDRVEFYVPDYRFDQRVVEVIPRLPRLRVIQTLTAGVDHIRDHVPDGVVLCNARGVHDASTAELAVGLTIASLRGIPEFVRAQDRGEWRSRTLTSLADHTVLIVGYGSIGVALERRLRPFECDVLRVARRARDGVAGMDALPQLLGEADVVILVVPITDETHGMVDAAFLAAMRDGALLVNVARGPIVQTEALLAELQSGRLRAALDVTDPEPLPPGHPLWSAPGVLISPHVGGGTDAMWPPAYALVRRQLEHFTTGERLENVMTGDY